MERDRRRRSRAPLGALALVLAGLAAVVVVRELDDDGARVPREAASTPGGAHLRTVFVTPGGPPAPRRPATGAGPRAGVGASPETGPEYEAGTLLVRFATEATATAEKRLLERADAEVVGKVEPLDVQVLDVPPGETREALTELEASPAVEYVERDVVVRMATTPNDQLWPEQWGPRKIAAPAAWDAATGDQRVVVAVLDTGVDGSHPDLRNALVPGYDFVNGDADAADDQGHGTAAAGVLAARTNNNSGQAGVCWSCSMMPVKVLDQAGIGNTATLAAGIVWAVDHGAKIVNMSLGADALTLTLRDALEYADSKGVLLVAAAGNEGSAAPRYPAAWPTVIGVAATTPADQLYSWSNFGDWVTVAAPGCNVAPYPGASYIDFCGTSSAAPVVAGLVALALSARPDAPRDDIVRALRAAAVPTGGVRDGRVNAGAMLAELGVGTPVGEQPAARTPPVQRPAVPVAVAQLSPRRLLRIRYCFAAVPAGPLRPAQVAASVRSGRSQRPRTRYSRVGARCGQITERLGLRPPPYRVQLRVIARNGVSSRFVRVPVR